MHKERRKAPTRAGVWYIRANHPAPTGPERWRLWRLTADQQHARDGRPTPKIHREPTPRGLFALEFPMDMPQQPAMPPEEPEGEEAGTEITLAIAADGALSVYLKRAGQEEERQAALDIGGALRTVLDLYKREAAQSGGDPAAQFDQGFAGGDKFQRTGKMTAGKFE